MPILMRLLAAYAMLTAVIVAVQFVFAVDPARWGEIDWLMAAAIIISLVAAYHGKRRAAAGYSDGEVGVRRFLDANVPLVAASALLIAFAFQWSVSLSGHEQLVVDGEGIRCADHGWNFNEAGQCVLPYSGLWAYINPLFVVVAGAMGARMWSAAGRRAQAG